jgi:DNA-binding transcriptional ArsR family regulator
MASRQLPTAAELDAIFDALAHDARRQIVLVLAHYGPELPSGYLATRFAHSWPTTTRHLRVLERAGVVSVRREGRNVLYRLERDEVVRVVGRWLELIAPDGKTARNTWRSPGRRFVQKGQPRDGRTDAVPSHRRGR